MRHETDTDWMTLLPDAVHTYRADRRIQEVECIVPDIAGVSRGKAMMAHKFATTGTSFLPTSIFYQTITGGYVDVNEAESWSEPDMVLQADYRTACAAPWADDVTIQVIHDLEDRDGHPILLAPRNVLRRVLALYAAKGWQPVVAPELEFFLTQPNIDPNQPIEPPVGRTGRQATGRQAYSMVAVDEYGPVIDTIYDYAEAQGFEIDTVMQEGGAGQVEINLLHGDPLTLADQVFYFKRTIREAALKCGMFATFMAKPMRDEPGSAMHLHQSVLDTTTGRNIFSNADGTPSVAFDHFIGGSQKYLKHMVPLMAPYVNSYRRFKLGDSAPTNIEWAQDNRSTGLRVPVSGPEARRLENRVIGMDCNPYLAIAASLASGYLGMRDSVTPRPEKRDADFSACYALPRHLEDALELFAQSAPVREVLGPEFCTLFDAIKREEAEDFHGEISPWERQYLLLSV
jgi:glutamine synthetase